MLSKLTQRTALVTNFARTFSGVNKNTNAYHIELNKKYVCHNYNSYDLAVEKAERCFVWDIEGRKYFDFMAGFGSTNQGHAHPEIVKALIEQAHKVTQTSRSFYNTQLGVFAEYICNLTGYDKFLPSSGGVEACESACKLARRWGYNVKGVEANKAHIIMCNGNFWGRSITASGACDDDSRSKNFGPFTPGFPLVDYNNLEALEAQMMREPNLVAVYLEPIQGEGGIIIPQHGYLSKVKALCEKYNCLFIADEVQTGFGRTGKLLGYEFDMKDTKPDMLVLAKSISGGVIPVSGVVCNDEIMMQIQPGDHGSTYGGNPLGMAVAKRAVEVLIEEKMVENSATLGEYLFGLNSTLKSPLIKEVRGRGLFQGIEFHHDLKVDGNDMARILF